MSEGLTALFTANLVVCCVCRVLLACIVVILWDMGVVASCTLAICWPLKQQCNTSIVIIESPALTGVAIDGFSSSGGIESFVMMWKSQHVPLLAKYSAVGVLTNILKENNLDEIKEDLEECEWFEPLVQLLDVPEAPFPGQVGYSAASNCPRRLGFHENQFFSQTLLGWHGVGL